MKKYVIITGGELLNKGAQAMVFISVDEMKKRFPGREIVMLSIPEYEKEKGLYAFKIYPAPGLKDSICCSFPPLAAAFGDRKKYIKGLKHIFKNAELLLDISGYALASNWGIKRGLHYLRGIRLAKKYRVPVYILPQSFGPFDFRGKSKILNILIKHYMSYPRLVMAREQEGRDMLEKKYRLKNVIKTEDMVLLNRGVDPRNIYAGEIPLRKENIEKGSVAIIPNVRNNKYGNENEMYGVYSRIIDFLLEKGRKVYLLSHSKEDSELCIKIRDKAGEEKVTYIDRELSCLEFDETVKEFDFIIASRYHAIVHAYRNCVPAVILGWAVKYRELSVSLGQEKYQFDVRNGIDIDSLTEILGIMNESHDKEAAVIAGKLENLRKENIFDLISEGER